MPNLKGKIKDVVAGDDFSVFTTLDNVGTGQNLISARMTVKEEHWDSDDFAMFQKVITTTPISGQGHITDDGTGDDVAVLRFDLTQSDTNSLHPYLDYVYDIQVKTNTGKIYTPEQGIINVVPNITVTTT